MKTDMIPHDRPDVEKAAAHGWPHLMAVVVVAAGALLAACSSSSTSSTTTTAPPGGKLSASNAAYIASDLKAPAGSLTAAGSTFVQPFFTKAFYTYTPQNSGVQVNYSGVGSGAGITDFQAGIGQLRRL